MVFECMIHFVVIHLLSVPCASLAPVLPLVTSSAIIAFAVSFMLD